MKKIIALALVLITVLASVLVFTSCSDDAQITIAIPNDTSNGARALQLLEAQGLITLKAVEDKATLSVKDIETNPYNIKFEEVEAAQLPNVLSSVDYAVINSNYAIPAGLTPFVTEGTDVSYPNIIAVKEGNETSDKIKALIAAVNSQAVVDFIASEYKGAIVCDIKTATDGTDSTVDYAALAGTTITIAASPVPHADILEVAKTVLAEKNITLEIREFTDYVQPNNVVEDGEVDANYFQHVPYLNDFNAANGTHIVSVCEIHHEPMGVYSSKNTSFDAIKNK